MSCDNCLYQKDIQDIKNDLRDIKIALLGNDFSDQRGLIKNHMALEKREALNNKSVNVRIDKINMKMWLYAGIGIGASTVIGYVISLFKH